MAGSEKFSRVRLVIFATGRTEFRKVPGFSNHFACKLMRDHNTNVPF